MKRKLVLGIVVVAVIVAVAMFAGCIEEPEITPTPTSTPTPTPTPTSTSTPTPTPSPTPKMEIEWFQAGNIAPVTKFQIKEPEELEDNRIGGMWRADVYTKDGLDWFVNDHSKLGLKRIRLTFDWFDWDEVANTGEYSKYDINPYQDKAIKGLADKGMKITYTLVFWDPESPQEEEEGYSRFKTEEEIQHYLDYAKFIVNHSKGYIEYYEILNEPITGSGTQQSVEVDDYINLVKRVIPVIRQEDTNAKIIVGAIPNLYEPSDYDYLLKMLSSDIMPMVDAVSFHPMHGVSPDYELREDYYKYPSVVKEIKDIASAHGFNGEYIADELVWRSHENYLDSEPWTYSEIAVAKYYARGIIINLGLNLTVGLAEVESEVNSPKMRVIQNLCVVMAGAEPVDLPVAIQSEATNIRSYSFSLSNGDKLVVLWTDGVAVDDDLGVSANLTIQDITSEDVMGVDVLNGYQQSLVTSNENGNLAIQNLIVRDYPMILRIAKSSAQ